MKEQEDVFIEEFHDKYIKDVVELWNSSCGSNFLYKQFTDESFIEKFIKNQYFTYEGTFVLTKKGKVIGFANGIFRNDYLPGEDFKSVPGYITMILVRKGMRGQGYGSKLLKKVEEYLIKNGKRKLNIDFFNPINLEWTIPGTGFHDHPNAPGVDMEGLAYEFLLKNGYIHRATLVSMYRPLNEFRFSNDVLSKYIALRNKNITIQIYDKDKHLGLQEFFDNLKNEHWRKDINDNLRSSSPKPFLVALRKDEVCGFAGPLEVEKSGRGKFCGIGVEPAFEGNGIGKLLFFKLCSEFKNAGASFMSLFTVSNGNARRMYKDAGFTVVREWSILSKNVNDRDDEDG